MELSELISYAEEKYHIREQRNPYDPPGTSSLCHPKTKKKIAHLMREWNGDIGEYIERCDMKCVQLRLEMSLNPFLSEPFVEHGKCWTGVKFDSSTDKEVVLGLFDRAFRTEERLGMLINHGMSTIILASQIPSSKGVYQDTPISGSTAFERADVPEPIRRMLSIYTFDHGSHPQRCLNFYRQGKMMEDYEDDAPWTGECGNTFLPTYHDLNIPQLRGYFTWRTKIRKGEWQRTCVAMAYIYIYELLNGIGAKSLEERLEKLLDFEKNYIATGLGPSYMSYNVHRWMLELAVINNMPAELAMKCANSDMASLDTALAVLYKPREYDDAKVVESLCFITGMKTQVEAAEYHLVAEAWHYALQHYNEDGKNFFTACFGEQRESSWDPLGNAVYYKPLTAEDTEYVLNDVRRFQRRNRFWHEYAYIRFYINTKFICGFLHQSVLRIRRYLKSGKPLRVKYGEEWALPYVNAVIEEDKRRREEEARPKIEIHLEHLDSIREDAIRTRDSLLVDEVEEEQATSVRAEKQEAPSADCKSQLPIERRILRLILDGESPAELMKSNRLMPSIVADSINEEFFDEIGDNIVECDDDRLTLVEDYTDDVRKLMDN